MKTLRSSFPAVVGALGTVYGDIGTSPLYAFRESLAAVGPQIERTAAVLGVLSLIFWSLLLIVTLKYVALILRADNDGEGGILSLLALVQRRIGLWGPWAQRAIALGVLGTALFYCDALITPAISVLSAVEGLELLTPDFKGAVLPITLGIIVALFAIQRRGTDRIGRLFGPIMMLWFVAIGLLGLREIVHQPQVLLALNPLHGLQLLCAHPGLALVILGAIFLAVTGGEALYADMGHFGKGPVRIAWFTLVWPGLILNYFGQGALLLSPTAAGTQPFYALCPAAMLPMLVMLATAATVIASQATISGAFSITRQAVQLDLLPRLRVVQTSSAAHGQIYVPAANLFMLTAVILFVVSFGSSSALSAAYGASVVGTMLVTTILGALAARMVWRWRRWQVAGLFGVFLLIDLAFVAANLTKVDDGGWVPLSLAAIMFAIFIIWRDGRIRLRQRLRERAIPCTELARLLEGATRVPGAAVFLVSHEGFAPTAFLRNLKHNHVYHEQTIFLHLKILRAPREDPAARTTAKELLPGVYAVQARFGFMETPDVGEALRSARLRGLRITQGETSYFIGWHLVRAIPRGGWEGLQMRIFAWLQRRSAQAAEFFRMPLQGVMVLATDIDL